MESHHLFLHKTNDGLKISLENVLSNGAQEKLIDQLGPYINTTVNEEKLPSITFNHIAEEVYFKNLYMNFRKLGYHGLFTRYNGDKGMALFQRERPGEAEVKHSFFRSEKPNTCWY